MKFNDVKTYRIMLVLKMKFVFIIFMKNLALNQGNVLIDLYLMVKNKKLKFVKFKNQLLVKKTHFVN